MAGDWIKFEKATPDKPEVWAIAEALGIDPDAVVGKLLRVWAWFDEQSESGNAPSVTKALLDRKVGVPGFCDAMTRCGWMNDDGEVVSLPNFGRHNGKTAKSRALTAKRVAEHKQRTNATSNESVTPDALPREEKRRGPSPQAPHGGRDRFADFWDAYPRKVGKKPSREKWQRKRLDAKADEIIADVKDRMARDRRWLDGYIPNPATYLNQERWNDEVETRAAGPGRQSAGNEAPGQPRYRSIAELKQ